MLTSRVDLEWVAGMVRAHGLKVWFAFTSLALWLNIADPWVIGFDTRLAVGASGAWLAGGNPWAFWLDGGGNAYHFASLPPTVIIYSALVPLGPDGAALMGLALSVVAGIMILRRLRLPMWWWLFAPLNLGVVSTNPDIAMLALLLVGAGWLAPFLKIHAIVPLAGELKWRQLLGAGVLLLLSVVAFPDLWRQWLSQVSAITGRLLVESQGGWGITGPAVVLVVLALLVIAWLADLRTAAWLFVPAVWPGSEMHWSTLALPVIHPLLAVFLAVPRHLWPSFAVLAYAVYLLSPIGRPARRRPLRQRIGEALDEARLGPVARLLRLEPSAGPDPAPGP